MSKVKKVCGRANGSTRGWRQWKEADARKALSAWRRSGLSMTAFCAREGYSDTRLRYWAERLGNQVEGEPEVSFVPVEVGMVGRAAQLEIEHAGVVVRMREDMDVEQVARLVLAIAAGRPLC